MQGGNAGGDGLDRMGRSSAANPMLRILSAPPPTSQSILPSSPVVRPGEPEQRERNRVAQGARAARHLSVLLTVEFPTPRC